MKLETLLAMRMSEAKANYKKIIQKSLKTENMVKK